MADPNNPLTPRLNEAEKRLDVKNKIINGGFDFWQRGTSFINTSFGYNTDRFAFISALAAVDVTREVDVPSDSDSTYSAKLIRNTAVTLQAGTNDRFYTGIEGQFTKDLIGKQVTLAFSVKASRALKQSFSIRNDASDRSFIAEFDVNQADTWERKYITFVLEDNTYNTDNSAGFFIRFSQGTGLNFQGSLGWQTGNFYGTSTQDYLYDTDNSYIQFSDIMFYNTEYGEDIPFQRAGRNYQEELQLCQRYFEKSFDIDIAPIPSNLSGPQGFYAATTGLEWDGNNIHSQAFATKKRTSPIMTTMNTSSSGTNIFYVRNGGGSGNGNHGGIAASETSYRMQGNYLGSGTFVDIVYVYYGWTADAEL